MTWQGMAAATEAAERSAHVVRRHTSPLTDLGLPRVVMEMAALCGVSRLAEITQLDRIGLPVFQAVRPLSRALSVHQGKGLTRSQAAMGAMMEAIESAFAENYVGDPITASLEELPSSERVSDMSDFMRRRDDPRTLTNRIEWVAARKLDGQGRLWVPLDCVSLDFTRKIDSRIEQCSNGLGAQLSYDLAVLKGILETIERDARAEWLSTPNYARSSASIETNSVQLDWFEQLREHMERAGIEIFIYGIPSVVGLPVIVAEVCEREAGCVLRRRCCGAACGLTAEDALLAAVVEAVQSRLSLIAGVRDDVYYDLIPKRSLTGIGFALPPSTNRPQRTWSDYTAAFAENPRRTSNDVVRMLGAEGYTDSAVVTLTPPDCEITVVKVFVPGLGLEQRGRRAPGR